MDTSIRKKSSALRGKLLQRGYTIRSFAVEFSFSEGTVHAAIRGRRRSGEVTIAILKKIQEVIRG